MSQEKHLQFEKTQDHATAMKWADEIMGSPNIAHPWIPQDRFIEAIRSGQNLSLTRRDKGIFGIGFGPDPIINPEWTHFSLDKRVPKERTLDFTLSGRWTGYSIETNKCAADETVEELSNEQALAENLGAFLTEHAPDSSTLPGNPEVIFWGIIRDGAGELAALAAIVQWESGAKMVSSVATRTDMRGQGLAQRLMRGVVRMSFDRGIERLNLAVFTQNLPARAVYERVGFTHMGDFNYFERFSTQ